MTVSVAVMILSAIPSAEMAGIFEDRLARLDKLVVQTTNELYLCPVSASPLDEAAWHARATPGDGGTRRVTIVRPDGLDEDLGPYGVATFFSPGRSVRRLAKTDSQGRTCYMVYEGGYRAGAYTPIPLLQAFDLQMHHSMIAGLNILSLLRDPSIAVLGTSGDVTTYGATIQAEGIPNQIEHYEFDLNTQGTPMRLKVRVEIQDGSGYVFTREVFTRATTLINGAELVTETVAADRASSAPGDNYGIDRMVVTHADQNPALTVDGIRIEPTYVNSHIWIRHADLSEAEEIYDQNGQRLATATRGRWRGLLGPGVVICAVTATIGLTFLQRRRARPVAA